VDDSVAVAVVVGSGVEVGEGDGTGVTLDVGMAEDVSSEPFGVVMHEENRKANTITKGIKRFIAKPHSSQSGSMSPSRSRVYKKAQSLNCDDTNIINTFYREYGIYAKSGTIAQKGCRGWQCQKLRNASPTEGFT